MLHELRQEREIGGRYALERALRWLRSCARCESFLPPIDLYCDGCWGVLSLRMGTGAALLQNGYPPLTVYALFKWTEEADADLRPLLYGLKGGDCRVAIRRLGDELSFRRDLGPQKRPPLFVFPPATTGSRDHAWALAMALARRWGATCIGLEKRDSARETASQKRLSARERALRRYKLPDGSAKPSEGSKVVFVDDVITTGSTATAAYLALGEPSDFEVWTIAARPKLASLGPF